MTTPPVQDDPNPDDPNPARSSATLASFVQQVQDRLGIEVESEAEVLVRAVLRELGTAISSGLAQDLTVSLPPELSAELRAQHTVNDQARSLDRRQLVEAVSGNVRSVDEEEVDREVEQVLRQLRAWLPESDVDRVLEQMPGGIAEMMR